MTEPEIVAEDAIILDDGDGDFLDDGEQDKVEP
jgi:hypothetical protein